MFLQCRDYLLSKLKAAGFKTRPITTRKELERAGESHLCAVLFESDEFLRNGSKRICIDKTGASVKRRTVFDRSMVFSVVIGDYTEEQVALALEQFVALLDRGITIGNQYVPIEVAGADWVDAEDSMLKSKMAVQLQVRFLGGIYQDTSLGHVRELEIEVAEKEGKPYGN